MRKATYILNGSGLTRVDRGIPNYEHEHFENGLVRGLGDCFQRVELHLEPKSEYRWSRDHVLCFVGDHYQAEQDLVRLCRIVGNIPDDHVLVVSNCEGFRSVHRTLEGAKQAEEALIDSEEIDVWSSLVRLED